MQNCWKVWSPYQRGTMLGVINADGNVIEAAAHIPGELTNSELLKDIWRQLELGVAGPFERKAVCSPYLHPSPKNSDCKTLEEIFEMSQSNKCGRPENLRPISPENRFRGKVDWQAEKPNIQRWLREGLSVRGVAARLNVSPSTLSMANRRHGIYKPRDSVQSG